MDWFSGPAAFLTGADDVHYYNENDPFAAAWLAELMKAGLIPLGQIDTRSIVDVRGGDLEGFIQCHFFAGIGGWPYALRLAAWPEDRPVWTGSCPCQPFSVAGKGKGEADERHLWPEFQRLIAECRPPVVLGEQVASAAGRQWLAGVRTDLEALGYAVGGADLCAAGVGAPHIRQRLYWVAQSDDAEWRSDGSRGHDSSRQDAGRPETPGHLGECGEERGSGLADTAHEQQHGSGHAGPRGWNEPSDGRGGSGLADTVPAGRPERGTEPGNGSPAWSGASWLDCRDGKRRRVEPFFPVLVDGLSKGMGALRQQDIEALETEVTQHGAAAQEGSRKTLLNVWQTLVADEVWKSSGGQDRISEAQILFAFLCQLEDQGWHFSLGAACAGTEIPCPGVQFLWQLGDASYSPYQRGLAGQPARESSDLMRLLSSVLARHASEAWGKTLIPYAVSAGLLAHGVPNRVGKLRGFGNAIVPQVAAAFVEAYRDAVG